MVLNHCKIARCCIFALLSNTPFLNLFYCAALNSASIKAASKPCLSNPDIHLLLQYNTYYNRGTDMRTKHAVFLVNLSGIMLFLTIFQKSLLLLQKLRVGF